MLSYSLYKEVILSSVPQCITVRHRKGIRVFPSEFFEKPNMNLNIQKFKVQVRKMWFRDKRECQ
jgi:hypothetical protein